MVRGDRAWEVEEEGDAVWALYKREFEVCGVVTDENCVFLGDEGLHEFVICETFF